MSAIVSRDHLELIWDRLGGGSFEAPDLRTVKVGRAAFKVLFVPRKEEFVPDVYVRTGLSFYAWPRLAGYRYRFVLVPRDVLAGPERWAARREDVVDWIRWSAHLEHVVTLSTLKSGASYPFALHAQSFPLNSEKGVLSALTGVRADVVVDFGEMPHFQEIRIELLRDYPVRGVRITAPDTQTGRLQAADKAFELAANYDGLKAFNLIIVPRGGEAPALYLFPRRKDGKAVYGPHRWQIAALEVGGLLQAKSRAEAGKIDARTIRAIFKETSLNQEEFDEFCKLIESF